MSMEKEDCQIDVVHALQDVIAIVLKYLDRRDLISVSRVCKSWQDAALHEQGKRCRIQHVRLPYDDTDGISLPNELQDVKPCLSLWIFDKSLKVALYDFVGRFPKAYQILEEVEEEKPSNKTILFQGSACFATYTPVYGDMEEQRNFEQQPGCRDTILGLFLPNAQKRFSVRAACMWHDQPKFWCRIPRLNGAYHKQFFEEWPNILKKECRIVPCVANRLTEELGLNDCEYPKSTILFIGFMGGFTPHCIFELCKREQQNGKEVTLASVLTIGIVQSGNCPKKNHDRNSLLALRRHLLRSKKQSKETKEKDLYGIVLRISGLSVESWSTFIFIFATSDEIEKKLHQLKEKVKRKRYCTGLFFAPRCCQTWDQLCHINHPCGDSQEMLNRVIRIFPDIPFLGTFTDYNYRYYEVHNCIPKDEFDENDVTKRN